MPEPLPLASTAATALPARPVLADDDALYPSSDGRPMAENTWQARAIVGATNDLVVTLPPTAFVATDLLVYPRWGRPDVSIAPDVLVACGLGRDNRSSYMVWKEGKPPDWVLEVASPSTVEKDLEDKRRRYAEMGVSEYWLFDPRGDLFRRRGEARLQGHELVAGSYQRLPVVLADGTPMVRSGVLKLGLRAEGLLIRFRDLATGEDIPHLDEHVAKSAEEAEIRRAAEARAEREAAGRRAAHAQARQEAALRRAAETEAETEAALRRAAETEAETEAEQRRAAEARIAELEALLRRSQA